MKRDPKHFEDLPEPAPFGREAVLRDLGDGLVLRRASAADAEALAAFNQVVHADPPDFVLHESMRVWTRELAGGAHPRMRPEYFTIVEDVPLRRIASSLCTIPQRFAYGGIELEGALPELVGTHPAYRKRGLVAAQFDVIHRWGEERGEALQVIDGIPFFYRQFGYEMALPRLPARNAPAAWLPEAPAPGLRVRDATARDAPLFAALYERACRRQLLCCPREEPLFRYDLAGRAPGSEASRVWRVVESDAGEALAGFCQLWKLLNPRHLLHVSLCEAQAGVSWEALAPTVLHALREAGTALGAAAGRPFGGVSLVLGEEHPLYAVAASHIAETPPAYAWYVRVPDLPGFLTRVAPALERSLAGSPLAGHTGRLALSFYREGLRLVFEAGKLAAAEPWSPTPEHRGDVAIPGTWVLHLLFGWRSFRELEGWVPDCVEWRPGSRTLLEALFPRRGSWLWPFT